MQKEFTVIQNNIVPNRGHPQEGILNEMEKPMERDGEAVKFLPFLFGTLKREV